MATDDGYTVSLLHMDGADASTTFTDESGKVWTAYGNAQIDTAQSKFGGASGLFDGTGDYIYTSHNDFKAGTADFTVDFWLRTISLAAEQGLFDFLVSGGAGSRLNAVILVLQTTGRLNFYTNTSYRTASNTVLSTNTWYHIVFTRISGVFKYFINGTLDASTTTLNVDIQSGGGFVGGYADINTGNMNAHMDELRYSKGIARWTADFTPPTSPYAPPSNFFLFF